MTGNELAVVLAVPVVMTTAALVAVALLQRLPKMIVTVSDAQLATAMATAVHRMIDQLNAFSAQLGGVLLPAINSTMKSIRDMCDAWNQTPFRDGDV